MIPLSALPNSIQRRRVFVQTGAARSHATITTQSMTSATQVSVTKARNANRIVTGHFETVVSSSNPGPTTIASAKIGFRVD